MGFQFEFAGKTDVGMKRKHNQDYLHIEPEHDLFVVADGMGGHASGEVASKMAVETLTQFYQATNLDENKTWPFKMNKNLSYQENRMVVGVQFANKQIFQYAQADIRSKGMGTTIVSLHFDQGKAYIGHVGDSRVYRIRDGNIEQITEDHSLLNDYMKIKKLTEEEIRNFPHKNVIVRALGMKGNVQVDIIQEELQSDDVFLMCSDGLSGLVEDPEMLSVVEGNRNSLDDACQILIDLANERGGSDNITVVLAKVV